MPVYEYACEKCGHEFEVSQRITDEPVKTCPVCRARKVKRLISQTSFVLKGGGWYSDLYSSGKGKDKDADKSDSGSSESGEKPAAKSSDAKDSGADTKPKKKDSGSKGKGKKKSSKAAA
jgi:putative FmdB family regulatory protein